MQIAIKLSTSSTLKYNLNFLAMLLVMIIPEIIRRYPNVHFIIGGDGPKMMLLRRMCEKYNIHDNIA